MRLSGEEGLRAASYLLEGLPVMPRVRALIGVMPKTCVELVRGVNERGVQAQDAESIADYLARMIDSMRLARVGTFDECCSHVLGRRWSQVDYSGESLDPRKQERFYSSRGVPDLLTAVHVRRYFAVESEMPYFKWIFNPQGPLPEF